MLIIHGDEQSFLENNIEVINEVLRKVNVAIENKEKVFSHLIIDGVEIYEKHEEYIKEHLKDIQKIEIVMLNINEMIWETMESIHAYLERAIPALTELVDESYENFSSKSWDGINQLAEGMQWILQFMEVTKSALKQPSNWEQTEISLQQCESSFAQLLEAVEAQDTILISDILAYEITPAYEYLEQSLAISLDDEEFLNNVN